MEFWNLQYCFIISAIKNWAFNNITETSCPETSANRLGNWYSQTSFAYLLLEDVTTFEAPYVEAIKDLSNDLGIAECYSRRREYSLIDSAQYYLSNIERISKTDYIPSQADLFHVYMPTNRPVEYQFIDKSISSRLVWCLI